MSGISKTSEVVFYPFSPGIPWKTENEIVQPIISKSVWENIVSTKKVHVLCPGFAVEALLLPLFNKTLQKNGIEVHRWIVPNKYNDILKYFKINTEADGKNKDLFMEFNRLKKAVESFPSPIFMDREDNLYFNCLFNYGETYSSKSKHVGRNNDSFWKQMLKNTCCFPYENSFQWLDKKVLKNYTSDTFKKFNIDFSKPFIVIDNNYISYNTADSRASIAKVLLPHQLNAIGATLGYKKYQCIVSSNNKSKQGYFANNVKFIPSWYDLNLFDWFALISLSSGIYSSDPNVYLAAALIGCENIFAGGCNHDFGWEFADVVEIADCRGKKRRWTQMDNFETTDIITHLT